MKLGKFNEIVNKNDILDEQPLETHENNTYDFEKDGILYHIEDLRNKFKGLFIQKGNDVSETMYKDYIDYLDCNSAIKGDIKSNTDIKDYSDKELDDIWKNDPGYINNNAFKELPRQNLEYNHRNNQVLECNGAYMQMGYHTDFVNYVNDAIDGKYEKTVVEAGKILERYGLENGCYLTEVGTRFEDLQLPVSEDKLEKHRYIVTRKFEIEKSYIASQPFDERLDKNTYAIQYKASRSIESLISRGFLREIDF